MKHTYTLKGLKTLNTSDGQALTATLYRGKIKAGTVEDDGRGAAVSVHFTSAAEADQFSAWVAGLGQYTYPACGSMDAFTITHNMESAVDMLLAEVEQAKESAKMDKASKTFLLYREAGTGEDYYNSAKIPAPGLNLALRELVALYRQKAPWFSKVKEVWQAGHGWTAVDAL